MEYAIFDALRCGFRKVVFIIRREIEAEFREAAGGRIEQITDVRYIFQDELAADSAAATNRKKPWGTAHAVLAAAPSIDGPFAVINADDFYGRDSFRVLSSHLQSSSRDMAMVGFRLRNTLSEFGPVSRGVCAVAAGKLQRITELEHIAAAGEGARYTDAEGVPRQLHGDEIVSMNMWGFRPFILSYTKDKWIEFLRDFGQSDEAEFYIPSVVMSFIGEGKGSCRVLETASSWFGVTYRQDRAAAIGRVEDLVRAGDYPDKLWAS